MPSEIDGNAARIQITRLRSAADAAGRAGQAADMEVVALVQSRRELESQIRNRQDQLGYAHNIYTPDGPAAIDAARARIAEISATADALDAAILQSRQSASAARATYQRHAALATRALRVAEILNIGVP